ncbi:hypothetical protein [Paraburkholderia terrae]|uniref:hypothetical protein n=1 Tax=Paraburkholderia terrae TaxID=311230 RepID=UPI001EE2506A|nr:hypothetical protein [Paraburkholderia terrae]GJH02828.1 hypothetical protein CBA19C8_19745 [Paraburkholderia terrae]
MKPVRTEKRNGYDIRIRTLPVHYTRNAAGAAAPMAVGHAAFVQIAREGEIYVDWHLPRNYEGSVSRDDAEAQALDYAVRLVERRPFDGPAPEGSGNGPARLGQVSRGTQLQRRS